MRVLLTTHYWWPHLGGIERVALRQAEQLSRRGHDVHVLTSAIGQQVEARSGPAAAELFEVTTVPAWNGLEARGVPWPVFAPRLLSEAASLVEWADVVLCHGQLFAPTMVAAWHARRLGRPLVVVQHNPEISYHDMVRRVAQRATAASLARWALARADAVLVPSAATSDYVRSLTTKPIAVLAWGIDLDLFRPHESEEERTRERHRLGFSDSETVVVAAGRLSEKNRFAMLVGACAAASQRRSDLRCVLLGSGPQMAMLRRLADELGADVVLPGFVDDEVLRAHLRCADLVAATAGENEGFGLLVSEALASGVPVVAASAGGQVDLMHDKMNGWLFDGTAEGLATALLAACDELDASGRRSWSERARSSVESLSWDAHCTELEGVFDRVGGTQGGPRASRRAGGGPFRIGRGPRRRRRS